MASDIRQTVDDIFHVACELAPESRETYLNSACAGRPDLRREIEELLLHYEAKDTFLERPALHDAARRMAMEMHLFSTRPEDSNAGFQTNADTLRTGELLIGRYRILDQIGKGGMGIVYLAEDAMKSRNVAIKVLPVDFILDEDRLARFNREGRMLEELKQLRHPNIAEIYEQTEIDGKPCLVLEYVPGDTLADRLSRGPMPLIEALQISYQIADALQSAHFQRIVHRDLKPANIKITPDGQVKVLDFGLAKRFYPDVAVEGEKEFFTRSLSLTESGMLIGTPAYMSPEQWDGRDIDQRADLWAFGCLLYEMLAGKPPFARQTRAETMKAAFYDQPDWAALPHDTPIVIQDLLRSCLQKSVDHRLPGANDAQNAIAQAMSKNGSSLSLTLILKSLAWKLDRRTVGIIVAASIALASLLVWKYTNLPEMLRRPDRAPIVLTSESDLASIIPRRLQGTDAQLVRAALMPEKDFSDDLLSSPQGRELLQGRESRDRIDEIINELKEMIKNQGEKAQLYAILAQAHLFKFYLTSDAREKDNALQAVNRAKSLNAESTQVLIVEGNVLNSIGKHGEAIEVFEKAKLSDRNNPDALLGLALAHDFSGDESSLAEGLYKAAIEARKTRDGKPFWEDYNDLGSHYYQRGDYEAAADAWREVIRINPLSPTGHVNLGNAFLAQGCFKQAEESYRKSITDGGRTDEAFTNLGAVYFFLGNFNDSINYLEQITREAGANENIDYIDAWNNLGDSHRLNNNPQQAADAYRTGLKLIDKFLMQWKDDYQKTSLKAEMIAKLNLLGQGTVSGDPKALPEVLIEATLDPKLECGECLASAAIIYHLAKKDAAAAQAALKAIKIGYSPVMLISNPDLNGLSDRAEFRQIRQEAQRLRGKC